jgi:hypothetical protein
MFNALAANVTVVLEANERTGEASSDSDSNTQKPWIIISKLLLLKSSLWFVLS